jgi:hypothetical protein
MNGSTVSHIKTKEDIEKIFSSMKVEDISANLSELLKAYKVSNIVQNKKALKLFFEYILEYSIYNVSINRIFDFMKVMYENILELSHLFQAELNEFIKKKITEIEQVILKKSNDLMNFERILINISLLIAYLTEKINQPNQILSNFITLLNIYINELPVELELEMGENFKNLFKKIYFIGILQVLSENTNSFNPILFNQIDSVCNIILEFLSKNKETFSISSAEFKNESILNILQNEIPLENTNTKFNQIINSYLKLIQIISNLVEQNKEEINFDVIFSKIIEKINNIEKYIQKFEVINNDITKQLLNKYETYKTKNLEKKNISINFMIIKRKAITTLEPDYEQSFLGKLIQNKSDNEKVAKAISKKIKNTKKQAIRNLKKEGKIIDVQRQKKHRSIEAKRKEELKASNQFVEQEKLEYKKLVTSQPKKRFKMKKSRGKI